MCTATRGATPVRACTRAASSIFSCGVRGTPACAQTSNRVPVFPNAQDGSSICCPRSADFTAFTSGISGHLQGLSPGSGGALRGGAVRGRGDRDVRVGRQEGVTARLDERRGGKECR